MSNECNLSLHPQQSKAYQSEANEILYGGAAGGGKSHLMRVAAIVLCATVPGIQVYLFRRLSDDLFKNHMTGPGSFPELLGPWMDAAQVKYNGSKNFLEFWNGSKIWLCHCQHEKDKYKYQGAEIHVLLIDELTHFTESIYKYLRARCRLGGLVIPPHLKAKLPLILSGSNPGGVGHTWVRKTFVKMAPAMKVTRMERKEGGMLRQYIPAKLNDNPTLLLNDPDYLDRLSGLGNPALVKAMRDGNWDIVAGGAIDDLWDDEILVIPRFEVPLSWRVDRSFDWGSTAPFSVGWWAEADGETSVILDNGEEVWDFNPPKGTLIRIYEWYGSPEVGSNQGLKMGSPDVAKGILNREKYLLGEGWIQMKPLPGPADSAIYGGADKAEETVGTKMAKAKVKWIPAKKGPGSRRNGLQVVRDRLQASKTGEGPGLFFCSCCTATIDTLPVLPRDERDPEDVDTHAEDHSYDEIRYKVSSAAPRRPKNITATHST